MNVYILLDRSGSMENLWDEALGSINGYVKALDENTNIMLAVFDSNGYDVLRDTTVKKWKSLSRDDAAPRGGTPLFDASARMMHRILDDNPEKAVFVVMTDGEENSSRNFRQTHVKQLTKELESKDYQVVFLGANFDKVGDSAAQYGLGAGKFMDMKAGSLHGTMTSTLAHSTMRYATTSQSINFTEADKIKAQGK